jgi:medium-chain acyl-[acyl-carrier-protein] hydrolase
VSGSTPWVLRWTPTARPRRRLICVPHAGVGASVYRAWGRLLPAELDVCAVQLPGREGRLREAAVTRMEPLVEAATAALRPYLDVPFAFFGHSMGALVAFEIVRRLRAEGWGTPTHLIVSGRRAPQAAPRHGPISHLADGAFIDEVERRYGGFPDVIRRDPELVALFVPGLRADFTVLERYTYMPEGLLQCPIAAFCGLEDEEATELDMLGWREQTAGPLTVRAFAGGHFFVQSAQAEVIQAVADELGIGETAGDRP